LSAGGDRPCNRRRFPSFRNVISGNGDAGVGIDVPYVAVGGNFIGTDSTGMAALGNGTGVVINGGYRITIGRPGGGHASGVAHLGSGVLTAFDFLTATATGLDGTSAFSGSVMVGP
jgi:hypothetical protein